MAMEAHGQEAGWLSRRQWGADSADEEDDDNTRQFFFFLASYMDHLIFNGQWKQTGREHQFP
jgi:hypothetical protein